MSTPEKVTLYEVSCVDIDGNEVIRLEEKWEDCEDEEWEDGVEYIRADLVPQWQPIETAPKDGTWVLVSVWELGPDVASARWDGSLWNMCIVGEYFDGTPEFSNPTHWQPINPPPAIPPEQEP